MTMSPNPGDYVEVRCCCNAGRLLGYVPFTGPVVTFIIPEEPRVFNPEDPLLSIQLFPHGQIEWARWEDNFEGGWAYKSNDYSLEALKRIPGWRTA